MEPKKAGTIKRVRAKKEKNAKNSTSEWWIRGTQETCDFFGISDETLRRWAAKGAPKKSRGQWDLRALMAWKYKDANSAEMRKLEAEASLKETKVIQEQLRLGVQKGKYIESAAVTKDLRRLFLSLKKSLQAIGHRVATDLNSLDPDAAAEAKKIVEDGVDDCLRQLAERGSYGGK